MQKCIRLVRLFTCLPFTKRRAGVIVHRARSVIHEQIYRKLPVHQREGFVADDVPVPDIGDDQEHETEQRDFEKLSRQKATNRCWQTRERRYLKIILHVGWTRLVVSQQIASVEARWLRSLRAQVTSALDHLDLPSRFPDCRLDPPKRSSPERLERTTSHIIVDPNAQEDACACAVLLRFLRRRI